MTPTQITKLIEHYGLPGGLEYDHDDDDFYSLPCSQTQHPLPHHFGLILLASHVYTDVVRSRAWWKWQPHYNYLTPNMRAVTTLTAALEIIE